MKGQTEIQISNMDDTGGEMEGFQQKSMKKSKLWWDAGGVKDLIFKGQLISSDSS